MQNDCAKEQLIERSEYYENDKSSQFYEAVRRFNILCNRSSFDSFTVDIFYQKFCDIKYIINPTAKSDEHQNDKEDKNKYLIGEIIEKFNRT